MKISLTKTDRLSKEALECLCAENIPYSGTATVSNVLTQITGNLPTCFWADLSHRMSYEVPGANFSAHFQNGYWDGRKKLFNKRLLVLPTGLITILRETCKDHFVSLTIKDIRIKPALGNPIPLHGLALRDYQLAGVTAALSKQRGMIHFPTGAGKTEMIADLISKTNLPTPVLIHKQDIFHQLTERLHNRLGVPIGKIGCGVVYPQNITVAMIQTVFRAYGGDLKKVKDVDKDDTIIPKPEIIRQCIERAECVIIDEAHHTSADIFSEVLPRCTKAFYRWGFSATPFREDGADLLLDAHTGPVCTKISASELIKKGYLAKPDFYLLNFNHGKPPATPYAGFYTQQIVNNLSRNKLIVQATLKAVASGKTCLIAVTRVEHGEVLEAMLDEVLPGRVKFASGKRDSDERKKILSDLDARKLDVVISTSVFGEGVDCPSLNVLINTKAGQSGVDSLQLAGRALRVTPTKKTATIIDIYDDQCKFFGKHSKRRFEVYQSEPEFQLKKTNSVDDITFN